MVQITGCKNETQLIETHVNGRWGWDIGYEVVVQDSLVTYFLVHECDFELFFPMEVRGSSLGLQKIQKVARFNTIVQGEPCIKRSKKLAHGLVLETIN
jgi:hypothetical protein